MPRILKQREKVILFLTLGVVVFSVIFTFLISPAWEKNEELNKKISYSRSKLKKYVFLLSQKDRIAGQYQQAYPFSRPQGTPDDFVNTLAEIENIAKSSGVKIIDFRPQSQKSLRLYQEIYIDLRVEADMPSVLKFIYNTENSLGLFKIRKMQLSAKPNSPLLDCTFTVSQLILTD